MRISTHILVAAGFALSLAACTSGDDPFQGSGGGTGTPGTPTTPGSPTVVVSMGSGTGANFTEGTIAIGQTPLSAGGTSSLQVSFVDQNDVLFTGETTVTFSSPCIAQGLATVTSPVTTTSGIASTTYVARGCDGTDEITATGQPSVGGSLTATGTIEVLSPTLGSIEFVSADPTNIGLKGMGGFGQTETSTVVFRVKDTTGGAVANATVNFTLSTTVGGITLAPVTGTTTGDGLVQTIVQAGSVPTPVRVTATIDGTTPPISTQSDQLTISTGIPDADSVSLSVDILNPEAFNWDGSTVSFTMRLADRFNNPVPDGTAVSFLTEGGSIQPNCATVNGACSVVWTGQNPRPPGSGVADGQRGRSGVIGFVLGEETFVDVNGNGVFDDGDTFTDVGEPYIDENENGVYDAGERFFDSNSDGVRNGPNGFWNGALCAHSTMCDPDGELIHVGQQFPIVMSGSFIDIAVVSPAAAAAGGPYPVAGGDPLVLAFFDQNGQPPPFGTTISVATTTGTVDNANETIRSTNVNGPVNIAFFFQGSDPPDGGGTITIEIETPDAGVFQRYFIQATDP